MRFSDLIAKRVPAKAAPQEPARTGFSRFLKSASVQTRPAAQPARPATQQARTQRPQDGLLAGAPPLVLSTLETALAKESRATTPRPSEVVRAVLATKESGWAGDHRAELLQYARARLPNQPETPMRLGPSERRVDGQTVKRPLAAEAFTGGGLFALGCAIEGVYGVEYCEYDAKAVETLKVNLDGSVIPRDALVWTPGVPDGGLDFLLGGPPCQPFSKGASLGQGEYGVASEKNMYPRILDWVADSQPRVVVMENSSEVATPKYATYFNWWWKQMQLLGYEGVFWNLDASSFGTPQARKRAFAIAWPKGAPWGKALRTPPPPTHGDPGSTEVKAGKLLPWTHAFDRLASGCCGGYGMVGCMNLGNLEGRCSTCIEAANFQPAPNQTNEQARQPISQALLRTYAGMFDAQFARIEKRRPTPASQQAGFRERERAERLISEWLSPTLTAGGGGKRMQESLLIPETGKGTVSSIDPHDKAQREAFVAQLQVMSVREGAKLQDVPQWWAFSGNRAAAWRQIGNGIPINLGRTVIRKVMDALQYPNPLPGSIAAKSFEGLWPLDAVDMCARSVGVQGYPEELEVPTWKQALTQKQRRSRPFADKDAFRSSLKRRKVSEERQKWWGDRYLDGVWSPQWEKIFTEWKPTSLADLPPGFLHHAELLSMLDGEDEETVERLYALYAKATGVSPQKVEAQLFSQYDENRDTDWYFG